MTNPLYDLEVITQQDHHPAMAELVDLLCHRTDNVNRDFFQAEVAYFLGLIPSSMRASINSPERGKLPINIYSIALATSGFGKGHSVSLMEDIIADFRQLFVGTVVPHIAEQSLFNMAVKIASSKGSDEDKELKSMKAEYDRLGPVLFSFDSGTGPALKQMRQSMLMSRIGALNFQMDEIGSNIQANAEVIIPLLELYDLGNIKTKLIKHTSDQQRGTDIVGRTPANTLMFGTTSRLFDGGKVEDEFYGFLETGYARRCFFGMGYSEATNPNIDPKAMYASLVAKDRSLAMETWKKTLAKFADPAYYNLTIDVPESVGIELITYRLYCERLAAEMPEHEVIRRAEISHRYFKALKLAGVYAFLDESPKITQRNLRQAIKVAEESGRSFQTLLKRERNFVRLAKYIASSSGELTHADLVEDLPYYPNSAGPRREIMDLAMAWGVSNHVVIKKRVEGGVDFFEGSTLEETDLNKLSFSLSTDFAADYTPMLQPFTKLPKMLAKGGLHWCNHNFDREHRAEDNVIEGFNMIVVDVDGSISLDAVHELMKDFSFITATTKRHTEETNRFRLILPMNYALKLDKVDYKAFMDSVLLWLPFESDESANQRSKKWMTLQDSIVHVHQGPNLVDVLPFIPKTKKNAEYQGQVADLNNLDHLERWFLANMKEGSRNNNLLNFAMMLKDAGADFNTISDKVLVLNKQSPSPLKEEEVHSTVLKSVASKIEV